MKTTTVAYILPCNRFVGKVWLPTAKIFIKTTKQQYGKFYVNNTITFTVSFSLYSSHFEISELNKILYDVTHWS